MASYVGKINIGGTEYPVGSTLYGTCNGVADGDSTSYAVSMGNFDKLETGITIHVKFKTANISGATKLKVGNQPAKTIINPGGQVSWSTDSVISFTYDGTNWAMNDGRNTTYSEISETNIKTTDGSSVGLITGRRFNAALTDRIDTSITSEATDTQVPSAKAVYSYVNTKTSGLTGAMHFKGVATKTITDGGKEDPTISGYTFGTNGSSAALGDVVIYNDAEYVWTGTTTGWELLGDEGSYALKTSTVDIGSASNWNAGSTPSLGTAFTIPNVTSVGSAPKLGTAFTIPNVTNKGSAASFSVADGTLTLTAGSAPTLGTAFTVPNVTSVGSAPTLGTAFSVPNVTSVGTKPSLTLTTTTVVKP